jgi:nucleoside-diphosphate-sugar epimerase
LTLHYGDLTDGTGLRRVLETVDPDKIYHLGAQSHVRVSFDIPEYTAEVVAVGTLRLIEAMRDHVQHSGRLVRYYQAGSSEMFGAAPPPQNEATPLSAQSLWCQQGCGALVCGQLPRGLRPVRLQRFFSITKVRGGAKPRWRGSRAPRNRRDLGQRPATTRVSACRRPHRRTRLFAKTWSDEEPVNIGTGSDVTIAELARLIADIVGFTGRFLYDPTKPDGTPRKLLDVSKLNALGWRPSIDLATGIRQTYDWYRTSHTPSLN